VIIIKRSVFIKAEAEICIQHPHKINFDPR